MSGPNSEYDPVEVTALKAEQVEAMRDAALAAIAAASDLDELKRVRTEHAGDRSPLALANREIGALPPQARKDAGMRVGRARGEVSQALATRLTDLEAEHEARALAEETVDVTLPWDRRPRGARHPITMMSDRIADIFVAMGWEVAEGPLVEAEWLNFDALNLGADHPARTMQDTFWAEPAGHGMVLRTHTSPVQARTMLSRKPPIYVICPGRVFRTDEFDATHLPVFHQTEGIAEALRARVFTKFWKHGARGGSGLGMYIVNGLVRVHGGELTISDAPGGGARIVVDWPVDDTRP
jgi:phenylalanyl-tRNA synthetase alpha chain